jgi:outer membrane protein assembly factor BamD
MKTRLHRSVLALALLLLGACATRGADPARLQPDELYGRGMAAYAEGQHARAVQFLEIFAREHLGDPRMPEVLVTLGRSHMERREFLTAVTQFQRVAVEHPAHPLNLDARFGICQAYYRLSPRPALDQEYTLAAIAQCEQVASLYPNVAEGRQARELIVELREKLAQKSYDAGVFYVRRRLHEAALVYFEDVVARYPETSRAPAALLRLVEAYQTLGYEEEAEEARARLVRDYPQSPEAQALRT